MENIYIYKINIQKKLYTNKYTYFDYENVISKNFVHMPHERRLTN